ncbi:hypothetical protein [Erwinia amylovora]|uniref:hypothetical protein n=1 Tax=Erwinia amylovora TaxID=552 RepID=UPI001443F685|nr:hypothetical protein [Erwinia amylovora]
MIIDSIEVLNEGYKPLISDYLAYRYNADIIFKHLKSNEESVMNDLKEFCYEVVLDYSIFLESIKGNLLCSVINTRIKALANEIKTCALNRSNLSKVFNLIDDATISRAINLLKNQNKKLLSHSFRIEKDKVLLTTFMNCSVEFYFKDDAIISVLLVDDKRFVCKNERNAVKLCFTNAIEKLGNV